MNSSEFINFKKRGKFFAVLFLFLISGFVTANQPYVLNIPPSDSLKNKYDISDPRNPKCPCHKHQKKADKEYRRLLYLKNKQAKVSEKNNAAGINNGSKKTGTTVSNWKRKPGYWNQRSGKKMKRKNSQHKNKKWFGKDIAKCFHW